MARILAVQGKPHRVIRHAWIEPLDIERVQSTLDENPGITHLATVHHETTTGRLNDLDAIGAICRQRNLALLLDGVSSFGAEAVKAEAWNLAAIAGTANKCLHGVPGLSFVIARKTLWLRPRSEDANVGSVYLDLFAYHKGQHGDGYSPFTPAVQAAFALREALAELDESGGWQVRQAEYLQRAARIYEELTSLNIYSLLNNNDYSSVLRSYKLPADCTYDRVHDVFKDSRLRRLRRPGRVRQRNFPDRANGRYSRRGSGRADRRIAIRFRG